MRADPMRIGGFQVRNTNAATMTRFLQGRIAANKKIAVGFANHHFVTTCQNLDCAWAGSPVVLVNDGLGIQIAARLKFGQGFQENMNGTDFVPRFLQAAERPYTIYLVGGQSQVVARAVEQIANFTVCRVVGFCDGFSLWQHEEAVLRDINEARPDILLVGLGNPIQEKWIIEHWSRLDVRVVLGVGALFDWMTGTQRRAPRPIQKLRLEWAYRLMLEPRRLCRRYTLEVFEFFSLVFRDGVALARRDG